MSNYDKGDGEYLGPGKFISKEQDEKTLVLIFKQEDMKNLKKKKEG